MHGAEQASKQADGTCPRQNTWLLLPCTHTWQVVTCGVGIGSVWTKGMGWKGGWVGRQSGRWNRVARKNGGNAGAITRFSLKHASTSATR